jgi:hypothetical protein
LRSPRDGLGTAEVADAVRHKRLLNLNQLLIQHLRRDHIQIRMLM